MDNYTSALEKDLKTGRYGKLQNNKPTVVLRELSGFHLTQMSFFADQKASSHKYLLEKLKCGLPQAGIVVDGKSAQKKIWAARLDPFKVLLISERPITTIPKENYPLDLSDAKTILQISGVSATQILARLCAVNFSEDAFPVGSFTTTGMHHVGVSVWHHEDGFRLLLPRSFAASLYHLILQISEQFGCEVQK